MAGQISGRETIVTVLVAICLHTPSDLMKEKLQMLAGRESLQKMSHAGFDSIEIECRRSMRLQQQIKVHLQLLIIAC